MATAPDEIIEVGQMGEKRLGVVVGGAGLIGGTIVAYYQTLHRERVDIRAPSSKKLSLRVESDILQYLKEVRPDFIINGAMANLGSDGQLACEVNYLGAVNLARAALTLKIPYIHISSAATLPTGMNLTEEDTLELTPALSNYAKSKLMAETTLKLMAERHGLDYSCIRLGIVYGTHDHKVQGFHRLLFSVADESMPVLFTRRNTLHSYSNAYKIPHFVDHILNNRPEFRGRTYHFVDGTPVDLARLIMTIKSHLSLNSPKELYCPYLLASNGKKGLDLVLRVLRRIGLKATMPPELIFLDNFYKTQTLSNSRLLASSFRDPLPHTTIYTALPNLIRYYLKRWQHENLLSSRARISSPESELEETFMKDPRNLLEKVNSEGIGPYREI